MDAKMSVLPQADSIMRRCLSLAEQEKQIREKEAADGWDADA
jgi:hypothetical protein